MKVRHKQARGGTRFFHRGYHRGYHPDIMFQRIPVDGAFVGYAEDEGAGEPQFGGFPRGKAEGEKGYGAPAGGPCAEEGVGGVGEASSARDPIILAERKMARCLQVHSCALVFRFIVGFGRFRRELVCEVHQLGFDVSGGFAADLLRLTGTKDQQHLPGGRDIFFDALQRG